MYVLLIYVTVKTDTNSHVYIAVELKEQVLKQEEDEINAELTRQEQEDVKNYKLSLKKERRESLAHRLYVIQKEQQDVELREQQLQAVSH